MSLHKSHALGISGIPSDYLPVTPDDANDMPWRVVGLYIEGAGNIVLRGGAGVNRTLAVPANFILYGTFGRVLATGTTATGIHAMVVPA